MAHEDGHSFEAPLLQAISKFTEGAGFTFHTTDRTGPAPKVAALALFGSVGVRHQKFGRANAPWCRRAASS